MEITVEKIAMVRESLNPQNVELNMDVDWSVEYTNTDQSEIKYDIILRASNNFNFKLEGLVRLECFEEFIQNECSQIIFHHACGMFMDMISLTRQSNYRLLNENSAVKINTSF